MLKWLQSSVLAVKKDREMGCRFMTLEEMLKKERKEGREEGREIGREEGREMGNEEATLRAVENLMDSLGKSAEEAMDLLRVPKEEWSKYLERLQEK